MDEYLRQLLRNYQASQDPEDAVKYANAMLRLDASPLPLAKPLAPEEIAKQMREKGQIEGYVSYDIHNFYENENGFESLMDSLSDDLIGTPILQDISIEEVYFLGSSVVYKVSGILDNEQLRDLLENSCFQCGAPFQTVNGVNNHLDENGNIDYNADADHVPYSEEP